jgi:SAM-dependent methyltransferase
MNWRIKGVIQKALSVTPGGVAVNDWLQKTVGANRDFAGTLASKVDDWAVFLSHTDKMNVRVAGLRLMEVGTGWFPTLPVCFSLVGVDSIVTFDLNRHLTQEMSFRMLAGLEPLLERIAETGHAPLEDVKRRYAVLRAAATLEQMLAAARIDYRSPADASRSGLPGNSVDIVFSNSVFEHVPPGPIQNILVESHRVIKPGGLSIHSANCGDHYAYFDKSITPINYLTYTGRQWRFWDNDLLYQNRLRPSDFIDMARQAQLEIPLAFHTARPELLDALRRLPIAPEFKGYPPEQLCATSVDFVGRKPAGGPPNGS